MEVTSIGKAILITFYTWATPGAGTPEVDTTFVPSHMECSNFGDTEVTRRLKFRAERNIEASIYFTCTPARGGATYTD